MTKKDYVAIAQVLRTHRITCEDFTSPARLTVVKAITRDLANFFAEDNPRFDRARFLAAVGVEG